MGRKDPALPEYGRKEAGDFLCSLEMQGMDARINRLVTHVLNRMMDAIEFDRRERERGRK